MYFCIILSIVFGLWCIPLRSNQILLYDSRRFYHSFLDILLSFLSMVNILCRHIHSFYMAVVLTPWYFEKITHLTNWTFFFATIDSHIFYICSHFLSVSERKSGNSSFSSFSAYFRICVLAGFCALTLGNWSLFLPNPHQF